MSIVLKPLITQAGLAAVMNASGDGLQATITHVALGDVGYEPDRIASTLKGECNRVPISQGRHISSNQIHITAIENSNKSYWVREVGFVLSDGTLLAIWSHPTQALAYKANDVDLALAFDLGLSALPADSIVIDGTGHLDLAPATESKVGVIRLATPQEAQGGLISGAVAMTPAGSQTHGDLRYAPKTHRHAWQEIDDKPATYQAAPHDHDERYATKSGAYPNLRAQATTKADVGLSNVPNYPISNDVTDGSEEKFATAAAVKYAYSKAINHRHDWQQIDGKPQTYPSTAHNHDDRYALKNHRHGWNEIDGKPATYPSTTHNHDERYAQQSGTYLNLRAQATTKADVGLANVPNYSITNAVTDSSDNKFATAGAVKKAYDAAKARRLEGSDVQVSGYLNYTSNPEGEVLPMVMDYTVPKGCVMVGLYSDYSRLTPTLKRWRVYYRTISLD